MSDHITNWMGQEIFVGDYVFRGARDGNTSSFKVGKVLSLNHEKQTARVNWLFEPMFVWNDARTERWEAPRKIDTKGSPSINSLCLISVDDYARLRIML